MKQVRELPDFSELKDKVQKDINDHVSTKIDEAYKRMPSLFFLFQKTWVKVLFCTVGLLFVLPFLFYWYKIQSFEKILLSNIDNNSIYEEAINQLEALKFDSIKYSPSSKDLYKRRHSGVPRDATIKKASNIWSFNIDEDHNVISRVGLAHWQRRENDQTKNYYSPVGYIEVNSGDVMPGFIYKLASRTPFFGKKSHFENQFFNKEFSFSSNDEIKARMIYTPLSMETTLKHFKTLRNRRLIKIEKTTTGFLIIYKPFSEKGHDIHLSVTSLSSANAVTDYISKYVAKNVVEMYKVLFMILIPPMI